MQPTSGMKMSLVQLLQRGAALFVVGALFALMMSFMQVQRHLPPLERTIGTSILFSPWWVPAICGTVSAGVGLLYPCIDYTLGEQTSKQEWSSVMRCIAVFVGINHASAKIDFSSDLQLSLSLTILSVGLWWCFDRTRGGFGLGVTTAVVATFVTHVLVHHGICNYSEQDLVFARSWLPCVFFSGGVTIGNIGRQLAMDDPENVKRHRE